MHFSLNNIIESYNFLSNLIFVMLKFNQLINKGELV